MQNQINMQPLTAVQENTLLRSVYNFMMMGLAISGVTAYMTSNSPLILNLIFGNSLFGSCI